MTATVAKTTLALARCFKLHRYNIALLDMANVDEFFWGWIIKVQNRRLELTTAKQREMFIVTPGNLHMLVKTCKCIKKINVKE